jgi:alkanesulfonate monooxygenase
MPRGSDVSAQIPPVEVSWFSALCDDDYEFLGVPDERLRSSYEHCRDIVIAAGPRCCHRYSPDW